VRARCWTGCSSTPTRSGCPKWPSTVTRQNGPPGGGKVQPSALVGASSPLTPDGSALDDINGALAQADVLGIFGREGLDLATIWGDPKPTDPGAYAFRMYRNYDGAGSRFGDVSVSAVSGDQGQLAVYGAQRSSDGALTVMVINKTGNDLTSPLSVAGVNGQGPAQRFTYGTADLASIARGTDLPVTNGGISATYPANSITLLVLP
jgi:hypothetical protein